jgi:radical SAM protein with 4Fe4S-binding SPASM domain
MFSLDDRTVLHAPPLVTGQRGELHLLIDPEAPNWIVTEARGAALLGACDGRATLGEIIARYRAQTGLDATKAWVHAAHFLREAARSGMVAETGFFRAPYRGRAEHLRLEGLRELWLHTNNSCNLACDHCLVSSGPDGDRGLDTGRLAGIIRQAFDLGVERFYFTGGEPLIRPDIHDLIGQVTDRTPLTLLTNGLLLEGVRLQKLRAAGNGELTVQISLDGSMPEVNDPVRGRGSFAKIAAGIRNAAEAGMDPTVTTTVTARNAEDVVKMPALLAELGARRMHLLWLHHRGRALFNLNDYHVPTERLIEVVRATKHAADGAGVELDNYAALQARLDAPAGTRFDLSSACWESLCVYSDGVVYPSAAFANMEGTACGSVLERPLDEIWREAQVAQEFRRATVGEKERCHSCHLKFLCGGGDIEHSAFYAKAMAGIGSVLALDPYCELHMAMIDDIFFDLAAGGVRSLNRRSGFDAPVIYRAKGESRQGCATDPILRDGHEGIHVATSHSNCALTDVADRSREAVRHIYGEAAETPEPEICCTIQHEPEDTAHIPQAVLERFYGCGSPVTLAELREGETMVDLGSGGGIDCFIAARRVGPTGRVIGVDMTDPMLRIARENSILVAENLGYDVAEFRQGYLEELPLEDAGADVITSNCVINLSPDKPDVFREMWRALRDHGRIVLSDIVADRPVPQGVRHDERLWGECIGGALTEEAFLSGLERAGFYGLSVLRKSFWKRVEGVAFYSLTVRGYKFQKTQGCVYAGHRAVYHGPFKAITDEEGHLFPRGEAVEVCTDTAAKLQNPPYAGLFTVLEPDGTAIILTASDTIPIASDACCGPDGDCC